MRQSEHCQLTTGLDPVFEFCIDHIRAEYDDNGVMTGKQRFNNQRVKHSNRRLSTQ